MAGTALGRDSEAADHVEALRHERLAYFRDSKRLDGLGMPRGGSV